MPPPSRSRATSASDTSSAGNVRSNNNKPVKGPRAKCSENQAFCDKLTERRLTLGVGTHMSHCLKKAADSLAKYPTVITSFYEAKAVPGIGDYVANIIFPNADDAHQAPPAAAKRQRPSENATVTTNTTLGPTNVLKRMRAGDAVSAPTAKEKAYEKAVQNALVHKGQHLLWKVVLLIDNREQKSDHMQSKCLQVGIPCEIRPLPIGDFTWVAQGYAGSGNSKKLVTELLLGTIVERKTLADLTSSIFGTRYAEQRMRLKESGLSQLVLLVEGEMNEHQFHAERCHTAIWETRLYLGFQAIQTPNLTETVQTLKRLHRRILQKSFPQAFYGEALPTFSEPDATGARVREQEERRNRGSNPSEEDEVVRRRRYRRQNFSSLQDLVFDGEPQPSAGMERLVTFVELKAKVELAREQGSRTVGSIHAAMLKQVPKFENKKVRTIIETYPTISHLMAAYNNETSVAGKEQMVANMSTALSGDAAARKSLIGPAASKQLYIAYTLTKEAANQATYTDLVHQAQLSQASNNSNMLTSSSSSAAAADGLKVPQLSQQCQNSHASSPRSEQRMQQPSAASRKNKSVAKAASGGQMQPPSPLSPLHEEQEHSVLGEIDALAQETDDEEADNNNQLAIAMALSVHQESVAEQRHPPPVKSNQERRHPPMKNPNQKFPSPEAIADQETGDMELALRLSLSDTSTLAKSVSLPPRMMDGEHKDGQQSMVCLDLSNDEATPKKPAARPNSSKVTSTSSPMIESDEESSNKDDYEYSPVPERYRNRLREENQKATSQKQASQAVLQQKYQSISTNDENVAPYSMAQQSYKRQKVSTAGIADVDIIGNDKFSTRCKSKALTSTSPGYSASSRSTKKKSNCLDVSGYGSSSDDDDALFMNAPFFGFAKMIPSEPFSLSTSTAPTNGSKEIRQLSTREEIELLESSTDEEETTAKPAAPTKSRTASLAINGETRTTKSRAIAHFSQALEQSMPNLPPLNLDGNIDQKYLLKSGSQRDPKRKGMDGEDRANDCEKMAKASKNTATKPKPKVGEFRRPWDSDSDDSSDDLRQTAATSQPSKGVRPTCRKRANITATATSRKLPISSSSQTSFEVIEIE